MRMWIVNPKIMCRNHLLGEHAEIHMFVWNIDRKHSVKGYIAKGLLETHNLYNRHEELAQELRRRGYQHNSELDAKWKLAKKVGSIDKKRNLKQLVDRCTKCRERHRNFFGSEDGSWPLPRRDINRKLLFLKSILPIELHPCCKFWKALV